MRAKLPEFERFKVLERQALHAKRLSFAHPITGEGVEVTEPLPDDLELARQRAAG